MDLKKLRRKLQQRHNAAVKYDASGSFSLSISSSSSSSSSGGGGASIYIRSMEFYDRNSVRIEGTEGEFDMICRSLGLAGPEDFAIPAPAWEAMQVPSSSDMVPRLKEEREEREPKRNDVAECPKGGIMRLITKGSWQKGELLGRGSFGSVYEGFSSDGFFFAVKEVSLLDQGNTGKQSVYQLQQEISILSQFDHENIVQYFGTVMDDSKLYIFLELVTKGSLASLYRKYTLQDSQVSAYTRQILHGLKYFHNRNVVHGNIKCANILVDANGSVKLADFGLAKAFTFLSSYSSVKFLGTAFWMAPEVVKGKNQSYELPADIWSLGCTVLEMLTGQIPYSELECLQALFRIGKGERPPIPDSLSRDARDFILQCLKVNPDDRPTAAQLLNHPFIQRPLSHSSDDSGEHDIDQTEGMKRNINALPGLTNQYGKQQKSVHWGDQVGSTRFSIGAARKVNGLSLVIGPGVGYNLKSNPLTEEESPTPNVVEPNKRRMFYEKRHAEQTAFLTNI